MSTKAQKYGYAPQRIFHLLIKGEFKVWCRPKHSAGDLDITTEPSKCNCVNCLTRWRRMTSGRKGEFQKQWTDRHQPDSEDPDKLLERFNRH